VGFGRRFTTCSEFGTKRRSESKAAHREGLLAFEQSLFQIAPPTGPHRGPDLREFFCILDPASCTLLQALAEAGNVLCFPAASFNMARRI
jgi:hypothetical protein